jgi:hypothetical protein
MKKDQLAGSGTFRAALLLRTAVALAIVLGISALMFTDCKTDGGVVFNPPVAWTQVSSTVFGTAAVQKVAFGNNTFVAKGVAYDNGTFVIGGAGGQIAYTTCFAA